MNLSFHPVGEDSWVDFESFFESKGSPHFCWCSVWRRVESSSPKPTRDEKKASIEASILGGTPVGILAYAEGEPVAWCSIAPRETYRELGGEAGLEHVWSLVCFFIQRPFRKQGIGQRLLEEAVAYARENGAMYVEAYPVDVNSPSYRFMGYTKMFEKAGFQHVKKAGKRRNVMLLEL